MKNSSPNSPSPKHVWLVMSGSGMKMYAFVGALKALAEDGYTFSGVTGTSGGATIAGALGKHWDENDPVGSIERMTEEATQIDPSAILKKSIRLKCWEWMMTSIFKRGAKGIFSSKEMLKAFRKHAPATIGACTLPVQITAFQSNLKSPRAVLFTEDDTDLPLAMLASMTLPVFDPTPYGKALLEDGGYVKNLPIPDDQPRVLALFFDEVGDENDDLGIVEDPKELIPLRTNVDRIRSIISGVLETNMRDAINEAEEEGVDLIKVKLETDIGAGEFFAPEQRRMDSIEEGYQSAKKVLASLK